MPVYEFYCEKCNVLFNFFSRTVNTEKIPACPRCGSEKSMERRLSLFSVNKGAKEDMDNGDLPIDESRMEKAMAMLAGEAERINEDDPRQAAGLMRKLTEMTGIGLGDNMEEALSRMEKGEDPDRIEAEMGDLLEKEDPFILPRKTKKGKAERPAPFRDETLYDL